MESIRFQTSTPSSGTDSIVDTFVIIFASQPLGEPVAVLINVPHSLAISRREYFRCNESHHCISVSHCDVLLPPFFSRPDIFQFSILARQTLYSAPHVQTK